MKMKERKKERRLLENPLAVASSPG